MDACQDAKMEILDKAKDSLDGEMEAQKAFIAEAQKQTVNIDQAIVGSLIFFLQLPILCRRHNRRARLTQFIGYRQG